MKIGIIGAGYIARAIVTVAMKAGHEVMVSNSRGLETLFTIVGTTGCKAGTPAEAAAFGDLLVVAIPVKAYHAIPQTELAGKVVLDAGNYYPARDGQITALDEGRLTSSEFLAHHLANSRIVKAFNAITAADIEKDGRPAGSADRRALPIVGDDATAKRIVSELFDEIGFDILDVGPLSEGYRFQPDTPAYCVPFDRTGLQAALDTV